MKNADTRDNLAPPRSVFGTGTYTGAELSTHPVRSGASDAAKIPSLINGRRVGPAELRAQLAAPLPNYTPPEAAPPSVAPRVVKPSPLRRVTAPKIKSAIPPEHRNVAPLKGFPRMGRRPADVYEPKGMPAHLLQHLRQVGGHMMFSEIAERFEIRPGSLDACLRKIFERGLLVRLRLGHMTAAALPGYVLPEGAQAKAERDRLERFRATRAKQATARREILDGIERAALS